MIAFIAASAVAATLTVGVIATAYTTDRRPARARIGIDPRARRR
ncbi:hypothetical protein [Nocardia sp. XZ_19_369]|nr:hypothetical protein [Nocardia sp. XZ_19_369]